MKKTIKQLEYQQRAATRIARVVEKQQAEQITRLSSQVDANAKTIAGQLNALRTLAGLCEDRGLYPLNVREARYAILRATA